MHRNKIFSILFVLFILSHVCASAQQTEVSIAAPPAAEDWDVLSVRSQHFQIQPAMIIEHVVKEKYTRDLVRVQWRAGDSIELFVYLPIGVKKAPAILYLYSYPADIDRFFNEAWAARATADGYAAIGFTSALTGQRYNNRPMKEWFVSELRESIGSSVHDVQMILDYVAARGDIDMNRIGMFGQGSGGAIAILAAQVDGRIQALDLLDPWGDWPSWLKESVQVPQEERSLYLTATFLASVSSLDPVNYLPHLKVPSLRIQQILDDPITPRSVTDHIASAAPPGAKVVQFADGNSHFTAMHRVGVSGWLKDQLDGQSTTTSSTPALASSKSVTATKENTPHH